MYRDGLIFELLLLSTFNFHLQDHIYYFDDIIGLRQKFLPVSFYTDAERFLDRFYFVSCQLLGLQQPKLKAYYVDVFFSGTKVRYQNIIHQRHLLFCLVCGVFIIELHTPLLQRRFHIAA